MQSPQVYSNLAATALLVKLNTFLAMRTTCGLHLTSIYCIVYQMWLAIKFLNIYFFKYPAVEKKCSCHVLEETCEQEARDR